MNRAIIYILFFLLAASKIAAQEEDSLDAERVSKMVSLSEVMVRSGLDVARFIEQVKNDTTFYKAFRNLHMIGYNVWNDIRIRDKKGKVKASMQSKIKQVRQNGCRSMQVLDENSTGDFYNDDGSYNYYTAELYAGLFFTKGTICNETNIVKGIDFNPKGVNGLEKKKQQLKMLFFNPGKKIPGIPFIGDKIDIFDPDKAKYYDFLIDYGDYEGQSCYIFSIKVKKDLRSGEKNKRNG